MPEEKDQTDPIEDYRDRISVLLGALLALGRRTDDGYCFCPTGPGEKHSVGCQMARSAILMESTLDDLEKVVLTAKEQEVFDQEFVDNAIARAMDVIEELDIPEDEE